MPERGSGRQDFSPHMSNMAVYCCPCWSIILATFFFFFFTCTVHKIKYTSNTCHFVIDDQKGSCFCGTSCYCSPLIDFRSAGVTSDDIVAILSELFQLEAWKLRQNSLDLISVLWESVWLLLSRMLESFYISRDWSYISVLCCCCCFVLF